VSEKEEMLTRIRRALGRNETVRPEPLTPFADGDAMRTQAETVGLFCAEFERAQGSIARVASAPELESRLESLLLEEAGATVALSDGVSNLLPGLAARLERRGKLILRRTLPGVGPNAPGAHARKLAPDDGEAARDEEDYRRALFESDVGVTTADYALADTGTLVLVSGSERHRLASLVPTVHVCLLEAGRILPDLSSLIGRLGGRFSPGETPPQAVTFITGPSRTADIEQTLTTGVHGPHKLRVIVYESGAPAAV
jgi:hypothetical protein